MTTRALMPKPEEHAMTTIVTIAKQAKVSAKVARAKLRRAGMKPTKDGWVFKAPTVAKVRKLIAA